jgi:ParB family chromosome partitioning protein
MLTTKRYDYMPFNEIHEHPDVANHRALDQRKVGHYKTDILENGLLEPLVVWEKRPGDVFLVGGFHRLNAIRAIRDENPGYFDRVDVRVVAGELDEIRALNLKLNADRVDTKITDYFEVVVYLNNANWSREKIAAFLDRSVSWIGEIIRFAPGMPAKVREQLAAGEISWARAKSICKAVEAAPAGQERKVLQQQLQGLAAGNGNTPKKRPLTFKSAKQKLGEVAKKNPRASFRVRSGDLMSLLLVLEGKQFDDEHVARVRSCFPGLLD